MSRAADAGNALAWVAAVALSVAAPAAVGRPGAWAPSRSAPAAGAPGPVVDASGRAVAPRSFARIVSGSPVADALLLELAPRDALVAVTAYGAAGPDGHRVAGLPTVERVSDVERLLALEPDLVVLHDYGELDTVTRLREAGLVVFDLGAVTGARAYAEDARLLAALLGVPERGDRLARAFLRRLGAVAVDVPAQRRPRAAYVAVYGGRLFGAAVGSSQHDVLVAAGLRDAATEAGLTGWPEHTPESLLVLAPALVVTQPGMRAGLCALPGLATAPFCVRRGGVVEVEGLDDGGPGMLDAAEALRDAVHGPAPQGASGGPRGDRARL